MANPESSVSARLGLFSVSLKSLPESEDCFTQTCFCCNIFPFWLDLIFLVHVQSFTLNSSNSPMRIRNSRPPFPIPLLRPPRSKPHLASYYTPKMDDPFLVEETSRRMGWSCYPLKRTESNILREESDSRLQLEIQEAIKKIFEDDESEEMSAMEEKSSDTWTGQGGGFDVATNNQEYSDPLSNAVNLATVLRAAFSGQGNGHLLVEKENNCERKTGAKVVKEEPSIPQTEMDGRKINNLTDAEEGNSNQKANAVSCVMNRENFLPPENDGFELFGLLDVDSDDTILQPIGGRRRKRKKIDDDCDWTTEYYRRKAPKSRQAKKVRDEAAKGKSSCPEKKPKKRGRPKVVKKGKVGRPRKSNITPSIVDTLRKNKVVGRRRRTRAGRVPSHPIVIS